MAKKKPLPKVGVQVIIGDPSTFKFIDDLTAADWDIFRKEVDDSLGISLSEEECDRLLEEGA